MSERPAIEKLELADGRISVTWQDGHPQRLRRQVPADQLRLR